MDRKYFGCISVHYNGREDMGVWCEMSGQGCRNFEDLTTLPNKWKDIFQFIHGCSLHITRLDAAYDDYTGILDEEFSKIPMDIGEASAGVLLNCLRFVEPAPSDSNKSCWRMADYWANLVGDVGRIKIFTLPGSDYNLEKCRHFVIDMAGNAIDAMLQIYETVDDW